MAAWERGSFKAEVVPVTVGSGPKAKVIQQDEGMRPDTTLRPIAFPYIGAANLPLNGPGSGPNP